MCTTIKWNVFYQISDNRDDSFPMYFHRRSFKIAAKEHEHTHPTFKNGNQKDMPFYCFRGQPVILLHQQLHSLTETNKQSLVRNAFKNGFSA